MIFLAFQHWVALLHGLAGLGWYGLDILNGSDAMERNEESASNGIFLTCGSCFEQGYLDARECIPEMRDCIQIAGSCWVCGIILR